LSARDDDRTDGVIIAPSLLYVFLGNALYVFLRNAQYVFSENAMCLFLKDIWDAYLRKKKKSGKVGASPPPRWDNMEAVSGPTYLFKMRNLFM
jgi:hypothetical protein